ncbi:MAG: hypothetical protein WKF42_07960, partial [Solirubrobacteraceae bacterium]
ITGLATGSVEVQYEAAGRRSTFTVGLKPAQAGEKHIKIDRALPAAQRRARTGILTVTYRGDDAVRSDTLRSRAANGRSSLRRTLLSFADARLVVRGTLNDGLEGVVRLRVTYTRADGTVATWDGHARVSDGRWSADQQLPEEAAADPNAYLTVQFTGSATARGGPYRGEQLGKSVGNLPAA